MSSSKVAIDRNQKILLELATQPGNDICADCRARAPRWASHNLGIFICVNCATIHRKIGTHITKVKSLTMDSWTKEQIERMREMGNLNSNAIYNPNELRHPPPPMLTEDERDSELEKYIRAKYEYKKFFDRHALVASKLGPSRSSTSIDPRKSTSPSIPTTQQRPFTAAIPSSSSLTSAPARSVSQPVPPALSLPSALSSQPQSQQALPRSTSASLSSKGGVWNDLLSLQAPSANSSLPLQYQSPMSANVGSTNPFSNMTGMNSAGFSTMNGSGMPLNSAGAGYGGANTGANPLGTFMSPGPNGLTINPPGPPGMGMGMGTGTGMGLGLTTGVNAPFSAGPGGMPSSTNPFQQQSQFSSGNPFAQLQLQQGQSGIPTNTTSAASASAWMPPFSSGASAVPNPTGLSTGFSTPFMSQSQASPMMAPMQLHSPAPMSAPAFSPSPQNHLMNLTQFGGHSPQPPQMPMSVTPQGPGIQGQQQFGSSPSPAMGMGMGMGVGTGMGMGIGMGVGMNGQTQHMQQQQPPFSAGPQWGQQPSAGYASASAGYGQQWGTM